MQNEMRANVDELLDLHRSSIDELRRLTADVFPSDSAIYDEIFLLRFVMTHSKKGAFDAASAEDAVRQTILWRTEHADTLDRTCANGKVDGFDMFTSFMQFGNAGEIDEMEPISCIRIGGCFPKAVMNAMTDKEVEEGMLHHHEIYFRICDERTRRSRQMVKLITVYDLSSLSLENYDSRFVAVLKRTSALSAIYNPQLLGKLVLINSPSTWALRVIKTLFHTMPSVSAKMGFCPVQAASCGKTASDCPFLSSMGGSNASVPPFLGGTRICPVALQTREENDDSMKRLNVPARSSKVCEFLAPVPGVRAEWELVVEEHGIIMAATFTPDINAADAITEGYEMTDGYEPVWGSAQEVMAPIKYKGEDKLQTGVIALPAKGMLRVTFDNSYSLLRSKTIEFRVRMKDREDP